MEKEGSTHSKEIEREKNEATEKKIYTLYARQRNVTFINQFHIDLETSVCNKGVRLELHLCACADAGSTMHHGNGEVRRVLSAEIQRQSSLAGCFYFITRNLQERRS